MDVGVLDTLYPKDRDLYVRTVLHLTQPGSLFFVTGWEWSHRWWERLFLRNVALAPGEVDGRFGEAFEVEQIFAETNPRSWGPTHFTGLQKPSGFAAYLMTRKSV